MGINATVGSRQVINQWIGMTFIALICFWVVLYYFVNKTEAFANDYIFTVQSSAERYAALTN